MNTLAVITTGGDAPGMNCAIRAVVRTAIYHNLRVFGIRHGWKGMVENNIIEMELSSVGNTLNRGGTILQSARYPDFFKKTKRAVAISNLRARNIDGLVVIGGDGSLAAAALLHKEFDFPVVNIPASIDNDIPGTDYTIGYDTAVNTAVDAIDKIRDTATSHERVFVVEVMGRGSGSIAINVGLVCGAEAVVIPEYKYSIESIVESLMAGKRRGKQSFIVVVAEGAAKGHDIGDKIAKKTGLDVRVSILGHIQRGGSPTALSREYACKLGNHAVDMLRKGKFGYMVGIQSDKIVATPITTVLKTKKKIDLQSYKLAQILAI
ncbi:MAG: 6-phosphofructokinase [Candidatus Margulisiibacteriota bacterium]